MPRLVKTKDAHSSTLGGKNDCLCFTGEETEG